MSLDRRVSAGITQSLTSLRRQRLAEDGFVGAPHSRAHISLMAHLDASTVAPKSDPREYSRHHS